MLNKVMQNGINDQVNLEFQSAYAYLALAAICEQMNFRGSAKWMRLQAEEEKGHAMRLFEFLVQRNVPVVLKAIGAPNVKAKSLLDVFKVALQHEEKVSASINKLYEQAFKQKAFATTVELNWFLTEQVEEEKTVRDIVAVLELVKNDPPTLLDIDKELGARSAAGSKETAG
jgi:ferritin